MAEVTSQAKYVRVAPRKLRLIADAVKTLPVAQAEVKLEMLAKSGALPVLKALRSAIANGVSAKGLNQGSMKIKNILIDEGFKMGRRGKGRRATSAYGGGVIQKRTSHITVILEG